MGNARRIWARGLAVTCATFLVVGCNAFDADLLKPPTDQDGLGGSADEDMLDSGMADDGGGLPSGTGGQAGDGNGKRPDGGVLEGCVENTTESSFLCPIVCPESCNNGDDDCDGEIDEDADKACAVDHAVSACNNGRCLIVSCKKGYRNCDDKQENGCEAAPDDIKHCGTCDNRCDLPHALMTCEDDECVAVGCKNGFDDCDDNENDCETHADTLKNCAKCGLTCTEGDVANAKPSCERGFCGVGECFMGYGDCNDTPGDGCEEALNSLENCGACGKKCDLRGSDDECSAGVCLAGACSAGYDDCDGNVANGCESLSSDLSCGGCGKTCNGTLANVDKAGCNDQACDIDCASGYANCDTDPGTGCETPVTTLQRCATCDSGCAIDHAIASCDTGKCRFVRCETGWGDCNADQSPDDGCETPLDTLSDCGACNRECDKANCSGGVCTEANCNAPPSNDDCGGTHCGNCDGNDTDCEADLETDRNNCGNCGNQCKFNNGVTPNATPSCSGQRCGVNCQSGFGNCNDDYRDGCEVALTSVQNCRGCGVVCAIPNGTPACDPNNGCRVGACAADFADCNNDRTSCETQLNTTQNCGTCGIACNLANALPSCIGSAGNHSCAIAGCTQAYFGDCDMAPGNGCEIDKRSSAANCGTCGNDCRDHAHVTNATCGNGTCNYTLCDGGWGDCTSAAGCETALTTETDCGACGVGCARSHGDASCSSGTCTLTDCDAGYDDCDGNAQNGCEPLTSLVDCGECGQACSIINGTGTCDTQECEIESCDADWDDCDGDPNNGCERNIKAPADGGQGPCLPDTNCTRRTNGSREYFFCTTDRNFADARARCQRQLLGDLVHIDDAAEQAFVQPLLVADAWLGGSDSAVEGTWRWLDNDALFWMGLAGGTPTGYTNWSANEPNNSSNEDCAMVYAAGKWNDLVCTEVRDFVCEVQPDLCPTDPNKTKPGQCGCGVADTDSDGDGTANCHDDCPSDTNKVTVGQCGCGVADTNTDGDSAADCNDACDTDPSKTTVGACGCGVLDTNSDGDSAADCNDACPFDAARTAAPCPFTYTPTNFVQSAIDFDAAPATTLNCQATTTIDTSTTPATFTNWCGALPTPVVQTQSGGPDVVIVPLQGLTLAAGTTLRVIGSRPVILAVRGDVALSGTINAKGIGATSGAGGNASCSGGTGANGSNDSSNNEGGGGGGGGGFGAAGAKGGSGDRLIGSTNPGNGGGTEGGSGLSPLRGGCGGGKGGNGNGSGGAGGAGGGAIQISASGTIAVVAGAIVTASGGGGLAGNNQEDAGGGGGSGGSVLLEATSVALNSSAWVTANGGGGASGSSTSSNTSAPGTDGLGNNTTQAPGGPGNNGGGSGGGGGASSGNASQGGNGGNSNFTAGGGGGGGGGGIGRVRVHGVSNCTLNASFSPASTNACP